MKNLSGKYWGLIGKQIRIDHMEGEPAYAGRIGTIKHVDSIGQIHGTWGGCAICPDYGDEFTVLSEERS